MITVKIFLYALLALSAYSQAVSAQCAPEQVSNRRYATSCAGCPKICMGECSKIGSHLISFVCSGMPPPFLPDRSHECWCCCAPVPVPSPPAAPKSICGTGQIYTEFELPGDNNCRDCTSGCRSECLKSKTRLAKVSCRKEKDTSSLACECCCRSSAPSIVHSVMQVLGY